MATNRRSQAQSSTQPQSDARSCLYPPGQTISPVLPDRCHPVVGQEWAAVSAESAVDYGIPQEGAPDHSFGVVVTRSCCRIAGHAEEAAGHGGAESRTVRGRRSAGRCMRQAAVCCRNCRSYHCDLYHSGRPGAKLKGVDCCSRVALMRFEVGVGMRGLLLLLLRAAPQPVQAPRAQAADQD